MGDQTAIAVNILLRREEDIWTAHCLELDIVAAAWTIEEAKTEVVDLIGGQVQYAFENNGLDHLYRPAPREIWAELQECGEQDQEKFLVKRACLRCSSDFEAFMPPWIITNTYRVPESGHEKRSPIKLHEFLSGIRPFDVVSMEHRRLKNFNILLLKRASERSGGPKYPVKNHGTETEIHPAVVKAALRRFGISEEDFWK